MSEEGKPRGARWRSVLSGILIVVALLLTPIATVGAWARVQLVDTDRFVATFAPLAEDPQVQAYIADEVTRAIVARADFDALVGQVFGGLESLGLPPRTAAVLGLLQGPAVQGLEAMVGRAAETVVTSPQFPVIWESALRATHSRTTGLLQGDTSVVVMDGKGVIAVDLGVIVEEVRTRLVGRNLPLAQFIPEVSRTIPLIQSDALVLVRTGYTVAANVGFWLPLVALALLAAGILLARDRRRAAVRSAWGVAGMLGLLLIGTGITGAIVARALSPAVPAEVAHAVYGQVTGGMSSALVALIVLAVVVALVAWITGRTARARGVRGALDEGFSSARDAADRRGLSTGALGRGLERWRVVILAVALAGTILVLLLLRPITVGAVVLTLVVFLAVVLAVELLRRPAASSDTAGEDATAAAS